MHMKGLHSEYVTGLFVFSIADSLQLQPMPKNIACE